MKTENHQNHTKPKKKEKPKSKPVFHKKSDAGKGDVPRQGIMSQIYGGVPDGNCDSILGLKDH